MDLTEQEIRRLEKERIIKAIKKRNKYILSLITALPDNAFGMAKIFAGKEIIELIKQL